MKASYKKQLLCGLIMTLISTQQSIATPVLSVGIQGTLTKVATDASNLSRVDGLAFDNFGNLFAAREIVGSSGGLTYVNKNNGASTNILSLTAVDQVELLANGNLIVSSELSGSSTIKRLYQVAVNYNASNIPVSSIATSITTTLGIDNAEGLVVIQSDNAYGNAGDILVSEDVVFGKVFKNTLTGNSALSSQLATGLARAEGIALGTFNGAIAPTLFATETDISQVSKISSLGVVSLFGTDTVGLTSPDNILFALDGYLYVSEDRGSGAGRIIRIDSEGNYSVFAQGFSEPQGIVIDPLTGDFYIAEQGTATIWKVSSVPLPAPLGLLSSGLLLLWQFKYRTPSS